MNRTTTIALGLFAALPACGANDRTPQSGAEHIGTISAAVTATPAAAPVHGCPLNSPSGRIHHVFYLQYDNVHFTRDNPNVPSDVEQMPNMLNFITSHGTLVDHEHTPLISHTADDILTSLTGVYPSHQGQAVANSYGFFPLPGTSTFFDGFASSFEYWTDIVNAKTDPVYNMITADGKNAPAPWVAYTRAGCNVGAFSTANIEFENVNGDVNNVYGPNSPEAQEASSNFDQAVADFEGIAVHCAEGSALCSTANGGKPDVLPQEPGGYVGFNGLFGNKFVGPTISPGGPVKDLDGNVISDGNGHIGFPGFDPTASQTLGYAAQMLENGVPVVFTYIADAHDDQATGLASGPGQADYVATLASYNKAWGEFFARLQSDGITPDNTLFVFTADEGDHFAGGPPSPAGCDGVTVPCTYAKIGEIDTNTTDLLNQIDPNLAATPFDLHFDMAPAFYISGNPAPGSPIAREYEVASSKLTATSLITGNTDHLTRYLADPVELNLLHMITGDPQRTPSFILFGNPDYFFQTSGTPDLVEDPGFAWNHGGVDPKINTTWLGMVGPGVANMGVDPDVWSDHTDIRPTMLLLLGLQDDYAHDGRALVELFRRDAVPAAVQGDNDAFAFTLLADAYKQITAPVGELGLTSLRVSTAALAGDDATYAALEAELSSITVTRDGLAAKMIAMLEGAEFNGVPIRLNEALPLVAQAEKLLQHIRALAP